MLHQKWPRYAAAALAGWIAVAVSSVSAGAQEIVRGGDLVVTSGIEPQTLDPIMGNAAGADARFQIFETLVKFDSEGNLQPSLATSWEYAEDGQSIVFSLREGVVFHDGTPFDAEAAAFNLRRVIDPDVNATRAPYVADVESIDIIDPLTIRVNLKSPSGSAISGIASIAGVMSSPAAIEAKGEDYGRSPVGTGPFKFSSWISGSHVKVEANENYWRDGADGQPLPYLDTLTVRFITEVAVKMIEIQSGSVHMVDGITPNHYEAIEQDPNLHLIDLPGGTLQFVALNNQVAPFDNELVRRAFSHAIDRQAMMQAVTRGFGSISTGFYYNAPDEVEYNTELARSLLIEAGYPDGVSIDMSIIQRDPDTLIGQIIQQQIAAAGFTVQLEVLERQAWLDKVLGSGTHQAAMLMAGIPELDPNMQFGTMFARDGFSNWSRIQDDNVFDLVEEAARVTDQDQRRELYGDIEKLLVEKSYYAFLFLRDRKYAASNSMQGFKQDHAGGWYLDETWLSE